MRFAPLLCALIVFCAALYIFHHAANPGPEYRDDTSGVPYIYQPDGWHFWTESLAVHQTDAWSSLLKWLPSLGLEWLEPVLGAAAMVFIMFALASLSSLPIGFFGSLFITILPSTIGLAHAFQGDADSLRLLFFSACFLSAVLYVKHDRKRDLWHMLALSLLFALIWRGGAIMMVCSIAAVLYRKDHELAAALLTAGGAGAMLFLSGTGPSETSVSYVLMAMLFACIWAIAQFKNEEWFDCLCVFATPLAILAGMNRYTVFFIPLLIIIFVAAFQERKSVLLVALAAVCIIGWGSFGHIPISHPVFGDSHIEAAQWLGKNAPNSSVAALYDEGYMIAAAAPGLRPIFTPGDALEWSPARGGSWDTVFLARNACSAAFYAAERKIALLSSARVRENKAVIETQLEVSINSSLALQALDGTPPCWRCERFKDPILVVACVPVAS